ncbi:hypothetical protein [Bifidobacterium catenulatum]|uniref:hypothetical protein n=1 Tax=Bifidobacterium catenulatum TaxID=1686 RepID=UPI003F91A37E
MKKKIVAILATIAAVFGFGFAANTAMAYGATGTVSGNVATFTFTGLTPGQYYVVSYDDTTVENVTLAATKYSNAAKAHEDGTLTATYTFKKGFAGTINSQIFVSNASGDPINAALASAAVTVAATGEGTAKKNETASTGAAIAPYVVAVVLLAAAGISLVAVRKSSAR